ncbi:MAG: hypothetical protein COY38_03230 [Candidatus Aenigmarchaeota archaeon CG_4_10_14_0_8_um_filter_37_24]|nr:hypothetical protein [Candidatus Aenigmarchaeota archaeon]OIN87120.1 MAG: hypothetical protein AUJ50_03025 [Candidatus Aenigmarchaeota archaeon CG1_02_38_14]PIV68921.1 MAG: hypothetical protein COS07_02530 [Candidatus Aenigmarchaeota archaeon CG01_land_8_20_14_3_00_37_9]PIW41525.1 MAG: hypothetical protein COW21_01360 [Candidatus Aenigmarchaeota archaeon CG15_BIG_FIL_POST_REV_8_21_14_020_37_27]PIX51069.1 MAG: hypothetical protein COZ52_00705 [Candidatus Aenigmarchaeota archaeon CG_4_8_14_3_u
MGKLNIQKIASVVMIVCGVFLIVTTPLFGTNEPVSYQVKNAIIGLGFVIGGFLVLFVKTTNKNVLKTKK